MFETLFAQACQLSKSIGLHHAVSRHGTTDGQLETERQNLFWSLFIVDVSSPGVSLEISWFLS
jgi:hypothetical protein